MSLFARCPHCGEYRTERVDRLPNEVIDEPCLGCSEFEEKLERIAEADFHDDELYERRHG